MLTFEAALQETIAHLASDEAEAEVRRDPYWPKWNAPWWRMTLLWELGRPELIPARAVRLMVEALNGHYLHVFPLTPAEVPPGLDTVRHAACHCALGTMAQVLHACGIDVDREVPWIRPWVLRYRLPDGGLNCDETVYGREVPHSSIVSTLPCAEAMLLCTARPFTPEEESFLSGVARYLGRRRLARSLSKGLAVIDPAWYEPCFPRFYGYDVLRGLRFLARHAAKTGARLDPDEVGEAAAALERSMAAAGRGAYVPRWSYEGLTTHFREEASGLWRGGAPARSFALLDAARRPEVAGPILAREWADVRAGL